MCLLAWPLYAERSVKWRQGCVNPRLKASFLGFGTSAYAAGTAELHAAMGVKCENCHVARDKTASVRKAACLKCRQS